MAGGSDHPTPALLVQAALAGDRDAWETLVRRYQNVAWKVVSTFDLSPDDRNDVFAATFFRLFERLSTVRDPERLPGWLATTARNEALALLRRRQREQPRDQVGEMADLPDNLADHLMDEELRRALAQAFAELDEPSRKLLALLVADPPLSYDTIAELTGRPRGSIGPTRQRCLERLRRSPHLRPFLDVPPC